MKEAEEVANEVEKTLEVRIFLKLNFNFWKFKMQILQINCKQEKGPLQPLEEAPEEAEADAEWAAANWNLNLNFCCRAFVQSLKSKFKSKFKKALCLHALSKVEGKCSKIRALLSGSFPEMQKQEKRKGNFNENAVNGIIGRRGAFPSKQKKTEMQKTQTEASALAFSSRSWKWN